MLGSLHGSTGPPSIKPKTGKPYGPDFPEFSVVDIVAAQRRAA
jgi:homoserine O-acetyltransferase